MGESKWFPVGKTQAKIDGNVPQSRLQDGDIGYIDGYVRGANDRPFAVFIRISDGEIDMVSTNTLTAIFSY